MLGERATNSFKEGQINFCLLNPAHLPPWFWLPTATVIANSEHSCVIPPIKNNLEYTAEQKVDVIERAMTDRCAQYIVAMSRGAEFAVRYIGRLERENRLSSLIGWMVINSVGPRGYELTNPNTGDVAKRHSDEYRAGIRIDEDGYETIDKTTARTVLLHDVKDEALASCIVDNLGRERALSAAEVESVPLLEKNLLPLAWYIGLNDRVDNLQLSERVARERLGVEPKIIPEWGHVAPITHTEQIAYAILQESQAAWLSRQGISDAAV